MWHARPSPKHKSPSNYNSERVPAAIRHAWATEQRGFISRSCSTGLLQHSKAGALGKGASRRLRKPPFLAQSALCSFVPSSVKARGRARQRPLRKCPPPRPALNVLLPPYREFQAFLLLRQSRRTSHKPSFRMTWLFIRRRKGMDLVEIAGGGRARNGDTKRCKPQEYIFKGKILWFCLGGGVGGVCCWFCSLGGLQGCLLDFFFLQT